MAYRTFVARAPDGLPLVEAQGEVSCASGPSEAARRQAQQLLTRLHGMPHRCSIECAGGFVAHLAMSDGVCYLGLFCQSYPHHTAFAFLEEIRCLFQEELKREFGTGSVNYRSHIETIEKPYFFCRFDRQVARTFCLFRDPASPKVMGRGASGMLHADLGSPSHTMRCSIDDVLLGGRAFGDLPGQAQDAAMPQQRAGGGNHRGLGLPGAAQLLRYGLPLLGLVLTAVLAWLFADRGPWAVPLCLAALLACAALSRVRGAGHPAGKAHDSFSFMGEYHADHML